MEGAGMVGPEATPGGAGIGSKGRVVRSTSDAASFSLYPEGVR